MDAETVDQVHATLIDIVIKFGPKLLAATLILALGYVVGRAVSQWLQRGLRRIEMEPPVRVLIVRITRLVISALFIIMALQNLGVELLPLIAGLGVVGAGIALAMQGVLSNLFAGLTIILTKPYRTGEYIGIHEEEGTVEEITLFHTRLSHPDRSNVIIPNRKIVGEILHNYGRMRQLRIVVGVAYDTNMNRALELIEQVLRENGRVLHELEPVIRVSLLADSSVNISVMPWVAVRDYGAATGEVNKRILEIFREQGVSIPFPQREVRLLNEAA